MKNAVVMVHKLTDAEVERLCCRQDFIKEEAAAEDRAQGDGAISERQLEEIYIKSEVPDAELEAVTVKDEPIDWHQEPQASSSLGSHAVTFKKGVNDNCTEARSECAEAEDKLREGSSGACNTSALHQGPAGASQGSTDSLPSDVSVSGSGVEAAPPSDRLMSRPLLCEHCDYSTGGRDLMVQHLCVRHKLGCYYECELCDYSTMYTSTLKRHVELYDHESQCKGLFGRYRYSGGKMISDHRPEKHGQGELEYEVCGSHLVLETSSEALKTGALDNNQEHKSEVCEHFSANEANSKQCLFDECKIGRRISKHGQGQLYMRKRNNYSSARKNEREVHQGSKDGKGKLFKCELCEYSSARKYRVERHRAGKHGIGQLFTCDLCDFSSAYECNVKLHLATKHGNGHVFECELCDYSSARKNNVELHRASKHGKGQVFTCQLCDYSSAFKYSVKLHLASKHGEGQLFKCELCEYSSAQKDKVKRHLGCKHGKGQLFKCELCDYTSARKDSVKRHQAITHGCTNSFPF